MSNYKVCSEFWVNNTRLETVGAEWVVIDNTVNVGIGTTSPSGKLDVNCTIYQRGSQLHADYVFEDDYQLESIEEHADFMWSEKHLKAVPGVEYDENGMEILEVGAHRRGILEELEKAHVYIEQLNNENKILKSQIAAMNETLCKLAPDAPICQ